jgi:murein DD-endopeptidase MepM/ murein hydrolase activator NlpD
VILIAGAVTVWLLFDLLSEPEQEIPETEEIVFEAPVINYEYDSIMIDSFIAQTGYIKRNQPLSYLLGEHGISPRKVYELTQVSEGVFDLRKIRSGNPYKMFFSPDSLHSLKYFVYEHTPRDYLAVYFGDSISLWMGQKPIDTVRSFFTGSIETSLWNLMKEEDANPMLAIELSEIYAWSIDFFGLQKGDSIRVIYDELFVDSVTVGIGKIHGGLFRHMETDFWAIPFVQDSIPDFYDEEGKSLRKAFLKAPLRFSRISSGFSHSRLHPILKIRRPHLGVDYAAPSGTPVVSIGDGVVIKKAYTRGGGNMLKIKHNSVYTTAYLHLRGYGKGIRNGAYVKQGDIIGYVGSTGLSTGPHLDFRFYKNGSAIDPLKVEAPPVDPVRKENMDRYIPVRDSIMQMVSREF